MKFYQLHDLKSSLENIKWKLQNILNDSNSFSQKQFTNLVMTKTTVLSNTDYKSLILYLNNVLDSPKCSAYNTLH